MLTDRTPSALYFSPSETDGVPSYLLVAGPVRALPAELQKDFAQAVPTLTDLYAVGYADASATATSLVGQQPLLSDLAIPAYDATTYTLPTDRLGRLLLLQPSDSGSPNFRLLRIDPATGQTNTLGLDYPFADTDPGFRVSPGRTWVLLDGWTCSPCASLCDLDGCPLQQQSGLQGTFVSEDFYYPAPLGFNEELYRLQAHGKPEPLFSASRRLTSWPIQSDRAARLLLSIGAGDWDLPVALLDPQTLVETLLPPEIGRFQYVVASPDGHWLAFALPLTAPDPTRPSTYENYRFSIFDWTTGQHDVVDGTVAGKPLSGQAHWRPGRDELWIETWPSGLVIWKPGAALTKAEWSRENGELAFTNDGRHWLSDCETEPADIRLCVGSADEPTASGFPLYARGTTVSDREETSTGQILVQSWSVSYQRNDIELVDPDTGTTRLLASGGHLVALGKTRLLALLDWQDSTSSGTLSLIDLATGKESPLAENVYAVAVDRGRSADVPPDADALAPGTQVAFLTRSRMVSPYDGAWVAPLP